MTALITPSSLKTATTTTTGKTTMVMPALSKATTISSIPVRAIPVPNTNKLILAGPCIVLRTATVAEQVQALRQEKKVASALTSTSTTSTTTSTVKTEVQTPELLRCKRRADLGKLGFPEAKPLSVSRRNARERNRVKLVNQGFDTLREHVPNGKKNRKMSKVDTLRSAVDYIRQLQEMIEEHDEKMECSSSDAAADTTITNIDSHDDSLVVDSVCEKNGSSSSMDVLTTPTMMENTTMTDLSVVNDVVVASDENTIKDSLNNNNNNNNKFVNFNVDNSSVSERLDLNTLNNLQQVSTLQELNSVQINTTLQQLNTVQRVNNVQQVNNLQQVNDLQHMNSEQANNVNSRQLLNNINSLNAAAFINTSPLLKVSVPASITTTTTNNNPATATTAQTSTAATTTSPSPPQTITVILHPTPIGINTADDVFLPDSQNRIRTSSSSSPATLGTVTSGTLATLTTLQGMGSLSGQGLTITHAQPCRRHLSFSEPEAERPVQIQPRLSLSEQSAGLLHDPNQQRQPTQHISFTLLPGQSNTGGGDLTLLNNGNNANTLALLPQPGSIDQQQQQHHQPPLPPPPPPPPPPPQQQQQQQQQQPQPEQPPPQFTTLSNLTLQPDQSANAAFSLDQSTSSLPLTDNHSYHQNQFQTLVAPSNIAMKQHQLQVDQVPSPSLSTSSSHMSESSYESYDSLGSLEEDLQDISNWITELCSAAHDITSHCDADEGVDFLAYNDNDNLTLPS